MILGQLRTGARQPKNAPLLWVRLFQMCFPDLPCYLSTFCTELNFSIKDSGSTASQPKIFCCVKDYWYPSSYLSPSQSPSLTSLSLSSSLCTATRCHDNRQFWSRFCYKFFEAREIWQIFIYCQKMPWKHANLKQVDQPRHKLPDWSRSSKSSSWKMLTPPLPLRHCTWDKLNR